MPAKDLPLRLRLAAASCCDQDLAALLLEAAQAMPGDAGLCRKCGQKPIAKHGQTPECRSCIAKRAWHVRYMWGGL